MEMEKVEGAKTMRNKPAVVISGISGRYPLSDDLEQFKENLFSGLDMVTADDERWPIGYARLPSRNGKVYTLGLFDRDFFGISAEQETFIDPQERLLLETTYEALIDAGINPKDLKGSNTGYFHGACYVETNRCFNNPDQVPEHHSRLVTLIPRFFGLRGPVLDVDTACGSGLSSFAEAFHSVRNGLCDMAIACSSNTCLRPRISMQFRDLTMITKDGKCKCLDSSADGYVRSEAIVVTIIQKSPDAKRVYCKLLSCLSNSDGYKDEGITFPSIKGQTQLLKDTYADAQIDPAEIGYIEAHMTGTKAGDPVEMTAMYNVICDKPRKSPLLVGCLKSNIGHTEGSSGLCAISKAIIVYQTGVIPPNIHYVNPNLALKGLATGEMVPVTRTTPFPGKYIPVNCFGFGGANTHLVTAAPDTRRDGNRDISSPCPRLVTICGRTSEAVNLIVKALKSKPMYLTREFLSLVNDYSKVTDVEGMTFRGSVVIETSSNGQLKFVQETPGKEVEQLKVCLKFSAQPLDSTPQDTIELCKSFPLIQAKLEQFNGITKPMGVDLFAGANSYQTSDCLRAVAVQMALVDLLDDLQIVVDKFFGYGTGELIAGYAANCLTAEEVLLCAKSSVEVHGNLKEAYEKIVTKPERRGDKWLSSGSHVASADYFASRVRSAENGFQMSEKAVELVVSSRGLHKKGSGSHSPTLDTLAALAALYTDSGLSPSIEKLYPTITYPLPSSTPFLSPLIKWDHSKKAYMEGFAMSDNVIGCFQTTKNIVFRFEQTKTDWAFLYDHKIDGRILFPATGYLMMVWVAFSMIRRLPLTEMAIQFEQIKFLRATVLSEENETALSVRLNEDTGSFELMEADNVIVTGRVNSIDNDYAESLPEPEPTDSSNLFLEAPDIYKELRVRGYDYGPYFQGLQDAAADGSRGTIVWRDIIAKAVKSTMTFETEEDLSAMWIKSWVPFVDSMFQLQLLQEKNNSRCLMVPTSIEQLTCYPKELTEAIRQGPQALDQVTLGDMTQIRGFCDPAINTTFCKGITVKGFKASVLQRKKQMVKVLKCEFVPLVDQEVMSVAEAKYIKSYAAAVAGVASGSNPDVKAFDLTNERHALLNKMINGAVLNPVCETFNKGIPEVSDQLNKDILLGAARCRENFENQKLFKASLDTCVYNLVGTSSKFTIDVLEVTTSNFLLQNLVREVLNDSFLYNQYSVSYNVLCSNPDAFDDEAKDGLKDVITWTSDTPQEGSIPKSSLIIYHYDKNKDNDVLMSTLAATTKEGGFVLVSCLARPDNQDVAKAIGGYCDLVDMDTVRAQAAAAGLVLISSKKLTPSLPFGLAIFRRPISNPLPRVQVIVGLENYEEWLEPLKEHLSKGTSTVWIAPSAKDFETHGPINGLLGFVKSLRLEQNGDKVRLVTDWSANDQVDINNPKYADVLERDLAYNILGNEREGWGTFEHVFAPEDLESDAELVTATDHVYLRSLKPGDLTSLTWVKNVVPSSAEFLKSHVTVHYAPLNFKDILFATGRLSLDAVPANVSPLTAQDSLLGLEYSGTDSNGNKVMGIVPYKALATSVPITAREKDFVWSVPEHWTLEDAATVPVVYATAIYALLIRGKMIAGETVLIHAGAGGVGLAAINVALAKKCRVFTTVGSQAKKDFLLETFKDSLREDCILNSRSIDFEDDVLRLTSGRGVDIVLNSLSDDKLQASLRCLADNGRFLEIGKVDFIADRPLNPTESLHSNKSIHGVFLDTLSQYTDDDYFSLHVQAEKRRLKELMLEGIEEGYVRPLPRTVFKREKIEDAFRFMSTGKHIGKVLIHMRNEVPLNSLTRPLHVSALKTTFLNPDKSYIVVGGLGGLGLELVQWLAQRGARTIVASSRRGLSSQYQKFVAQKLRREKVRLIVSQADVTSEQGAKTLIEEAIDVSSNGLGGIFNSAVVYKDCLFVDQTVDMFEQVCAPKAQATVNLDKVSRQLCPDLDYFVTFSSVSAGRGNEGQTNYNFANSTMDSICWLRRADGLHGLSVQWGVIGDVGLVAEIHSNEGKSSSAEVVLLGAASQRVHSVFETFDRLLNSSTPVMVSLVRPSQMGSTGKEGAADLLKIISNVVGLKDISSFDPNTSLGGLGIDSLIAVEIKQVIERVLGVSYGLKEVRELTIGRIIELSKGQS